jgi:hypothetical protein
MLPAFKYLDIPNFDQISKILLDLVTTRLYKTNVDGDIVFRFINTDNAVKFDIKDNKEFWNFLNCQEVLTLVPELAQALKNLGVTPLKIALILVTEYGTPIHRDYATEGTVERINWPIVNGNTSQTWFVEVLPEADVIEANNRVHEKVDSYKGFRVYDPKDVIRTLDSYILTQPVAFNFTVPHCVHTINNEKTHPDLPRLLLTIDIDRSLIK